jgi:hypothetical protein
LRHNWHDQGMWALLPEFLKPTSALLKSTHFTLPRPVGATSSLELPANPGPPSPCTSTSSAEKIAQAPVQYRNTVSMCKSFIIHCSIRR